MYDKKIQIIEAAIRCFAEKGYRATSIQEITDTLGIAKGSVYFYFKSKEDLFHSALKYYVDGMLSKLKDISQEADLPPRERLYRQVIHFYEIHIESREFLLTMFNERVDINEEVRKLALYLHREMLTAYHTTILDVYTDDLHEYSLDAVTLFIAIVNHYLHYMWHDPTGDDLQRLARFLLERLDDIVQGMVAKQQMPLLDVNNMSEFLRTGSLNLKKTAPDVFDAIQAVRTATEQSDCSREVQNEVFSALSVLSAELEKLDPCDVIVKGMFTYMQSFGVAELQPSLSRLEPYCI